jgi:methylmalonyl-CoA mutase C-terminal domain/subunit
MPGLVPGIHVFLTSSGVQDVDGRDKPGHDECGSPTWSPPVEPHGLQDHRGVCHNKIQRKVTRDESMSAPIRVLLAKVGLDGHDRGVKVVARALRDAGMDVIYTGLHRTPDEVVTAAIQEDVDVLGVSLLSGVQMTVFPKIMDKLKREGADDMIVVAGGVMPDEDVTALKQMGISEVMLQDTAPQAIVDTLRRLVAERGPR